MEHAYNSIAGKADPGGSPACPPGTLTISGLQVQKEKMEQSRTIPSMDLYLPPPPHTGTHMDVRLHPNTHVYPLQAHIYTLYTGGKKQVSKDHSLGKTAALEVYVTI